ncbi:hypothetical protein NDU88_005691 [Pleurodeles waltl]|uniref:Uncharacterized protein n=1 Tax=Pleurodeles waltl TaxID=8319 RepID=A0AAV7VNX8_PLEWA|nr:hypothetical protein NDU88_005691 [Pleurodeles waltl]
MVVKLGKEEPQVNILVTPSSRDEWTQPGPTGKGRNRGETQHGEDTEGTLECCDHSVATGKDRARATWEGIQQRRRGERGNTMQEEVEQRLEDKRSSAMLKEV